MMEQRYRLHLRSYRMERQCELALGGQMPKRISVARSPEHLHSTLEKQTRTVRNYVHDIMSPLNAMSGYLELLHEQLDQTSEQPKLERYSEKIADGLDEVAALLEELHEIFNPDSRQRGELTEPTVPATGEAYPQRVPIYREGAALQSLNVVGPASVTRPDNGRTDYAARVGQHAARSQNEMTMKPFRGTE